MSMLEKDAVPQSLPLSAGRLPQWGPLLVAGVATALAALLWLILDWGIPAAVVVGVLVFLVGLTAWSFAVENRRAAVDRLVTGLVWLAFAAAVVPLTWLLFMVISKGYGAISADFLTSDMRNVLGPGGGIKHALLGTVIVTAWATLISVPIGIFTAIYLIEYGKGNKLARAVTFLVDVMTGIPSIVAGLFALALFVLLFGPETRMGFMGSVALSLLMIPTVVRSTEEMLRLVPDELREASYALGVPKWRTITKVVLPTAMAGIVTGVVLAISRIIGETAPLLVVAGAVDSVNMNPFDSRMMTLPVYIYLQITNPGTLPFGQEGDPPGIARAWGAALVLLLLVMALNLTARIIGKIFSPKTGR